MSSSAAAKPAFLALSCVGFLASVPALAAEADSAKSLTFQDNNKVVIFIKGQEVTLEGRQTLQELTELGEKLKAANP